MEVRSQRAFQSYGVPNEMEMIASPARSDTGRCFPRIEGAVLLGFGVPV
ncbi:hypothetical protein PVAP13_2KG595700 [Panicum virgatum]|uniref:Uncharacterized protein n=1 Tax=Panicum virgatum TaxID=38727 RepID=A0A8T0WRC1_PANVG|nr:hypothetical protein PVAP13_2KG595700 [Panicum virgatum]